MISVKESKETCLSACRPFHASESKIFSGAFEVAEIPEKFLGWCQNSKTPDLHRGQQSYMYPESSPLSNCGDLRRLEMGESKGRKSTGLFSGV